MRRVIALLLPLMALTAITSYANYDRVQRRASRFAEAESKKMICEPDSYEMLDIRVDSAFVSYHNDYIILAEAARIVELERGGLVLSSSLQRRIDKHKAVIKARMSELTEGEFFGWEIRSRYRSSGHDGRAEISEIIIITDRSFDKNLYTAELCGDSWNSYCDLVKCVDRVIAEIEFKAALTKAYHNVSDAASVAFDKLSEGAEAAAKVVKKEGKVVLDGVKTKGAEVAEDISEGVGRIVERMSTEVDK